MGMKAAQVRQVFLDFFASKGHHIAAPASLLVQGDPTLLFTNAGMNPFKDLFLGNRTPDHRRVADTQPCLRVSGKHNDLEDVGKDTYHHTLFEMLGNWSFGDYFKEEAIAWAWELLTGPYGLAKDRLYVTYFEGDASEGLEPDQEARDFWMRWIAEDRILRGNKKDNFWEMGDTGPCGPCSEIHVDLRSEEERRAVDARTLVNRDHPQVIELWNLVFMQYQRLADGRLQPLPARHVDTGMGFERLCRAVVGASSNYDTDVFGPLIQQIEVCSGMRYGSGNEAVDIAMRVVADHMRAVCLVIADGQLPSNAKAGYVCRRILRRAIRYGYTYLGFEAPTLYRLVDAVVSSLGGVLPQLIREKTLIEQTLQAEETNFLRTLAKGLQRMDHWMSENSLSPGAAMDGDTAFELFDTYGFPPDLIALVLTEKGYRMDHQGFDKAMQVQRSVPVPPPV
jgi:alanyl-tRNA synthetase